MVRTVRGSMEMQTSIFTPHTLNDAAEALRPVVRAFLERELAHLPMADRTQTWANGDREFSRRLAAQGWVGITWPVEYGGGGRTQAERYVITEELLGASAPVSSHWPGDRQVGPLLLKFGTEELKREFLPRMAKAEITFCLGMSEPGAGSDLAAARTRATPADGGWTVSGQKIWTSGAHDADYMVALVRTADTEPRHAGLSQMIIDMKSEGITIRRIPTMDGHAHFNEVFFDDVFVPAGRLVGTEGAGWKQVSAELAFERSGPERYLSSLPIFVEFVRKVGSNPTEAEAMLIGAFAAEMWTLRQMSLSISGQLAAGENPAVPASIVKDLGTSLEQALPARVQALSEPGDGPPSEFDKTLGRLLQVSPSFSLRGGSREILRGIIAKDLGVR